MPKLYRLDVRLYATAYIIAEDQDAAHRAVLDRINHEIEVREDLSADPPIYGGAYRPGMPAFSFSPAMTISGTEDGVGAELVEDFDQPEGAEDMNRTGEKS